MPTLAADTLMDPGQIAQLIGSWGLPIVAVIFLWKVNEARTAKSEENCQKVQEAQKDEILNLRGKIDKVEDYVRNSLTLMISEKAKLIEACTMVMEEVKECLSSQRQ